MPPRRRSLISPASESERCTVTSRDAPNLVKGRLPQGGRLPALTPPLRSSAAHEPGEALARWLQRYHRVSRDQAGARHGPALRRSGVRRLARLLHAATRNPPSARCSTPRQRAARRVATSARKISSTPSPACPWPVADEGVAYKPTHGRATYQRDCATGPSRARPAPEAKDPIGWFPPRSPVRPCGRAPAGRRLRGPRCPLAGGEQ